MIGDFIARPTRNRLCGERRERRGVGSVKVHQLGQMATILFLRGVPEAIIRKLAGHRVVFQFDFSRFSSNRTISSTI